jgi:hypothetical protein
MLGSSSVRSLSTLNPKVMFRELFFEKLVAILEKTEEERSHVIRC